MFIRLVPYGLKQRKCRKNFNYILYQRVLYSILLVLNKMIDSWATHESIEYSLKYPSVIKVQQTLTLWEGEKKKQIPRITILNDQRKHGKNTCQCFLA